VLTAGVEFAATTFRSADAIAWPTGRLELDVCSFTVAFTPPELIAIALIWRIELLSRSFSSD
jgi:hypothetical protein